MLHRIGRAKSDGANGAGGALVRLNPNEISLKNHNAPSVSVYILNRSKLFMIRFNSKNSYLDLVAQKATQQMVQVAR